MWGVLFQYKFLKHVWYFARLIVLWLSPKVLPLGNPQTSLVFRLLNRTFTQIIEENDMEKENRKDVALVLSSGGPRGFAYIGAIESLQAHGFRITSVAGTSMGSLIGGIFAAGKLPEFKEWLYSLDAWKVFSLMDLSIAKNHIVKGERIIDAIREIVPEVRIEDLGVPFCAVAADLYTGEEVVFDRGPLFTAVRASISIPSLFRPVQWGDTVLVDGAVANCLPLDRVRRTENDLLVAFDVNDVNVAGLKRILADEHRAKMADRAFQESKRTELKEVLEELTRDSDISLVKRLKQAGSRGMDVIRDVMAYRKNFDEDKSLDVGDNYYDLLDRTFSLMNHRITELTLQLHRPDILVRMPFDSYGEISDYAKACEIAEIGRRLMDEAIDDWQLAVGS